MYIEDYLISVVTIVKNDLKALKKTLYSLPKSNSLKSIIIDGSNDSKPQKNFCQEFEKSSGIFVDYHVQNNTGLFAAMNEGLLKTKSPWVLFMCAGDTFDVGADKIFKIINEISPNDFSSIIFKSKIISSKGYLIGIKPPSNLLKPNLFKALNFIIPWLYTPCHQSVVFKTEDHKKILYEESGTIGSDEYVMSQFMKKSFYLSDFVVSCNDTCGVSSNPPPTISKFFWYLNSSIKLKQPRRFIFLIIKFTIASLGLRNFDKIRFLRHKFITPILLFFVRFLNKIWIF